MTQGQKYQEYKLLLEKTRRVVYSCSTTEHYQSSLKYIKLAKTKLIDVFYPTVKTFKESSERYNFRKNYVDKDFNPLKVLCQAKLRNLKQNEQIR